MAEQVGEIYYTVDFQTDTLTRGATNAEKSLDKLGNSFKKADKSGKSLSESVQQANRSMSGATSSATNLASMLGRLASAAVALATLKKLVDVQREFDRLNAGLVTATGGAENAAKAFAALQDFAAKTPFDLAQTTKAFTQLVNFGLDPSERALNSYGNTASALGKDLSQMVEAVADATTGEFERLKEFGIKAKTEGDKLSLTFRGTTTTIGNSAQEIEKYLIALGENEFAGNMAARAKTLDGDISNLGDTWDGLFRAVSQAGVGDLIRQAVLTATDALSELTAEISSGALQAEIVALGGKFRGFANDASESTRLLGEIFREESNGIVYAGGETVAFLVDAFRDLPENVRAFIQLMVVEVLSGFESAQAYATAFKDGIAAIFSDQTFAGVGAALDAELSRINEVRTSSIDTIVSERDAALDSYSKQQEAARKLREEFDKGQAASGQGQGDRLAQFRVKGTGEQKADTETAKAAQKTADAITKQITALQQQADMLGMTETEAELYKLQLAGATDEQIRAAASSRALIDAYEQQADAEKAAADAAEEAKKKREAQRQTLGQLDPIAGEQMNFEQQIAELKALNEAKLIEDQRYLDLKAQAETAHDQQMKVLQEENFRRQSAANELLMASLDQLQQGATDALVGLVTGASNGEEAIQALASSILNEAVGALVEMGVQYVKNAVMGQAAAATATATAAASGAAMAASYAPAAAAASIASFGTAATTGLAAMASAIPAMIGLVSGRQYGGPVSAGNMYRINENGAPEVFQSANGRQYMLPNTSGQVVSNKDATASGESAVNVSVNLYESAEKAGTVEQSTGEDGTQFINIFVADIMKNGKSAQAIQSVYGVKRQGR